MRTFIPKFKIMEKEQRKSLEQALAKVITDWVDFLGKDAGEKMEKPIKAAARDLMKKWNKIDKKSAVKDNAGESVSALTLEGSSPSSVKRRGRPAASKQNISAAPKKEEKPLEPKTTRAAKPAKKKGAAIVKPAASEQKTHRGRPAKKVSKK